MLTHSVSVLIFSADAVICVFYLLCFLTCLFPLYQLFPDSQIERLPIISVILISLDICSQRHCIFVTFFPFCCLPLQENRSLQYTLSLQVTVISIIWMWFRCLSFHCCFGTTLDLLVTSQICDCRIHRY